MKQLKEFLPLGYLLIIMIHTLITINFSDYSIGIKQYIGFSLLGISTILFFVNRKFYKYVIGLSLLIATIIPISFSYITYGLTLIIFQIYLIPLGGLFIYLFVFRKQLTHILFYSNPKDSIEEKRQFERKVERFKRNFSELSDVEIEIKMDQELVPEAKQALLEIKQNRN